MNVKREGFWMEWEKEVKCELETEDNRNAWVVKPEIIARDCAFCW